LAYTVNGYATVRANAAIVGTRRVRRRSYDTGIISTWITTAVAATAPCPITAAVAVWSVRVVFTVVKPQRVDFVQRVIGEVGVSVPGLYT
jgi:hypothetical protein